MQILARTCKSERMNFERLFARLLIAGGGLFWFLAAIGAWSRYDAGEEVFTQAWILLGITVVVLAIAWFYEVLAAMVLFVLTVAFVVYGFATSSIDEVGTWSIWLLFTAAPTVLSAVLLLAANRMQNICDLEERAA
jgi:hypothetical protein